eukprot:1188362-Prorocentrum_minimum.AAC.5
MRISLQLRQKQAEQPTTKQQNSKTTRGLGLTRAFTTGVPRKNKTKNLVASSQKLDAHIHHSDFPKKNAETCAAPFRLVPSSTHPGGAGCSALPSATPVLVAGGSPGGGGGGAPGGGGCCSGAEA